jgi:hypothetical protein
VPLYERREWVWPPAYEGVEGVVVN